MVPVPVAKTKDKNICNLDFYVVYYYLTHVQEDNYVGPRVCFVHLQKMPNNTLQSFTGYGYYVHVYKMCLLHQQLDSSKLLPILKALCTPSHLFTLPLGPHFFELLVE